MTEALTQALINPLPPADDIDKVNSIFEHVQEALGFVPDAVKLLGISPPLLETFVGNVGYFMGHPKLRAELLAMIRYLVSADANCKFCIDFNEGFLVNMGLDHDQVRAAREDPDKAPLPDNEKKLLKLALMAVSNPDSISQADINSANNLGWTDRDIFDAIAQASNNRALNYQLKSFNVTHQGVFA